MKLTLNHCINLNRHKSSSLSQAERAGVNYSKFLVEPGLIFKAKERMKKLERFLPETEDCK